MAVTQKLTLGKVTPSTKSYANALKLALAANVAGVKLDIQSGDAIALTVSSELSLSDANVIVRYLLNETAFDASNTTALLRSSAIEKEESTLTTLIYKKKTAEALQIAESIAAASESQLFSSSDKLNAVDVIYAGALYETLSASTDLCQYPTLAKWYEKVSKSPAVTAAVETVQAQLSSKSSGKKKQAAPKKVAENAPLPELNPATQKVNAQAILKKHDKNEKKEPKEGERNILITSALPYVNNIPHLGNIVGSTLSADVYARYCRARGYNAIYICGTDEYGTATETKALEEGVSCQALCDKYNAIHNKVYEWFDISFDHFGRTTTQHQTDIAQDIFRKSYANDYMSEDIITQLYCEQCERFLADRYVEGICPKCQYEDARGDQCDACGQLLNAIELIKPRCKLDGNSPITRESKHLFLDLNKLQGRIEHFLEKSSTEGKWSPNGVHITQSWLKEGLRPRCITRDLKWGTPVPLKGYENKVFYVWFDAPIGYPSITANYTDAWEKWWKNPDNVKLYQFMGKDNVPFHSVIFPGLEMSTGDNWTLAHHISTTEYLNYEGGKFSKSRNNGVFGTNAEETGIPPSVWRYYLLSCRPESSDSMFTWNEFITKNNSELLNNLGNFVNRAIKYIMAKYDGVIPKGDLSGESEATLVKDINELLAQYNDALENVKIRSALSIAMAVSARGNQYLQESNLSNTLFAEHRSKCDAVVVAAVNLIYLLSALIFPYMPATSDSISQQLNAPLRKIPNEFTMDILPGHKLNGAAYLFTRIDEKMEEVWKNKYGGKKN
ncbi:tRNA synthetases class I (M)-domain-containing protein [Radiomyces spectabilis]|uniref:tRNA synthetases class I (M)-domain-containing protein n=1 Tax=Radiomyces spectabilis TaxID=64574 RepID=UPI00221F8289|nr:tRNA synthetases class I (M)-domain-containing protein [Radiomyces spectabilis]KAI8393959.1 tRNA synthetases class I (M)-domain-containing protein [Radiomyces spectabilis]